MSPLVRLITSKEPDGMVFVSLEDTPVVLANVRRSLPALKKEIENKWPVRIEGIDITNFRPRRNNPVDLSSVLAHPGAVLALTFAFYFTKTAGTNIGDGVGKEITAHVRRRISGKPKTKPKKKPERRRRK
jgi:hypothetical protein